MRSIVPTAGSGASLYVNDAVATQVRDLLPEERAGLRRRGTWLVAAGCALLFPVPFLFFGFLVVMAMITTSSEGLPPAALGVLALMLVILPLLVVFGRHCFRRGFQYRQDARSGEVYRFERRPAATDDPQRDAKLHTARSQSPGWFEVLPASRVVWRSVDGPQEGKATPPFVEVADTPRYALTAAQWTEPIAGSGEEDAHFNHRALSSAELGEVLRHARTSGLPQLWVAVPLTAWAVTVLVLALQHGRFPTGFRLGSFLLLTITTLLIDVSAVIGLFDAWKLWQDRRTGRVIIVRLPETVDPETSPGKAPELSPASEYLPFSGRRWTVDGEPDSWRH